VTVKDLGHDRTNLEDYKLHLAL